MKTFYTLIFALFWAFTASAQTIPTSSVFFLEDFESESYQVTLANKANQWADSKNNDPRSPTPPLPTAANKHIYTIGNSGNTIEKTFNTSKITEIFIDWWQYREESTTIQFTYTINGVTKTLDQNLMDVDGGGNPRSISATPLNAWSMVRIAFPSVPENSEVHLKWTVTRTNGNSRYRFDYLSMSGIVPLAPLPVELSSFQGQSQNGATQLAWTTATEQSNEKFVVERSLDGKRFVEIGEVKGKGNSASRLNYNFTDKAPVGGTNYYRLRQVDFDGTSTYSNIVALEVTGKGAEIAVYPTVANSAVTISLPNVSSNTAISVVDITGRTVATFTSVTEREIELPVHSFRNGVYFVKVTNGQNQLVQRFIKQ